MATPGGIRVKRRRQYSRSQKKSANRQKWDTAFLYYQGDIEWIFRRFFCIKLLLYLSATVRIIKNPYFFIPNIHCNCFARCKKTNYFFIRNSPFTVEEIFLAMRVENKKVPYIYKEYEKVIKLRKKKSRTVKINIKYPKNGDFLANKIYIFKIVCFFVIFFVFRLYLDKKSIIWRKS